VYFRNYYSTEFLPSAQRRQFCDLLVQNPALLQRVDQTQILRLYRKLRFGAEEAALTMLGTWMQLNADVEPVIATDFFAENRTPYRHLTLYLVWQLPGQYRELEDRFLECADGRCSLPTAYTLAYSYLVQGRIEEWIELLENKLDENLSDAARFNWLLARGQAEEIRRSPKHRHHFHRDENIYQGLAWLDEAAMTSAGGRTDVRLLKERIARLAPLHDWERIAAEINGAKTALPDASSRQEIATLETQIATLKEQITRLAAENARYAELQYLNDVRERQQRAADRGDSQLAQRYAEIIGSLENPSADAGTQ
jgi:hypothetical protein